MRARRPVPSPRLDALRRKFHLAGSETRRFTEKYERRLPGSYHTSFSVNRGGDDFEVMVVADGWQAEDRCCGVSAGFDEFGAVVKRHGCWVNFELTDRERDDAYDALLESCSNY